MYPLFLGGALVNLREFRPDELDDVMAIVGDDRVTRWLSFDSRSREQAALLLDETLGRARSAARTEFYLGIADSDDRLVGFARLGLNGVRAAKLGYAVAADHWGRGYATDAARALLDFGFGALGLHRVSAAIGPDNSASIRVAERLGMRCEGRIRDHVFTNGGWRDSLLYAVLADEWALR